MEITLHDLIPWSKVGDDQIFFIARQDMNTDWEKPVLCLGIEFQEKHKYYSGIYQRFEKFCFVTDIEENENIWQSYWERIETECSEEEITYILQKFNEEHKHIGTLQESWKYDIVHFTIPDKFQEESFPITTLCGSTRFKKEFLEVQKKLTLEGRIVISVGLFGHSGDNEVWTEGTKDMLDRMHKKKIDLADGIFVINKGGYIGDSTKSEIEYAKEHGKTIEYLEPIV